MRLEHINRSYPHTTFVAKFFPEFIIAINDNNEGSAESRDKKLRNAVINTVYSSLFQRLICQENKYSCSVNSKPSHSSYPANWDVRQNSQHWARFCDCWRGEERGGKISSSSAPGCRRLRFNEKALLGNANTARRRSNAKHSE